MKILEWYKSLKGLRKVGVVMTVIMIIIFLFGPFLKAISSAYGCTEPNFSSDPLVPDVSLLFQNA